MHGHMNTKLVQVYLIFPKANKMQTFITAPLQEYTTSSCPEQLESNPQLHTI